eukprot:TRINITY_DN8621_c0_g1_i1.p1 TRINITY_DN8621_c0_g1~~TRINITY_DN8621_c0_g1_i1.p1  ORF type:complete len:436 (+),score=74.30 TRINITY_DN8621_c0_g1_i1:999-2306(+)
MIAAGVEGGRAKEVAEETMGAGPGGTAPPIGGKEEEEEEGEGKEERGQHTLLDRSNEHGLTPLHFAVRGGSEAMVRLLLRLGANVHGIAQDGSRAKQQGGVTPLEMAVEATRSELVDALVEGGAFEGAHLSPAMCDRLECLKRGLLLQALPEELLCHILSFLDYTSLCNASGVSKHMYRVSNYDSLWQGMFAQCGIEGEIEQSTLRERKILMQLFGLQGLKLVQEWHPMSRDDAKHYEKLHGSKRITLKVVVDEDPHGDFSTGDRSNQLVGALAGVQVDPDAPRALLDFRIRHGLLALQRPTKMYLNGEEQEVTKVLVKLQIWDGSLIRKNLRFVKTFPAFGAVALRGTHLVMATYPHALVDAGEEWCKKRGRPFPGRVRPPLARRFAKNACADWMRSKRSTSSHNTRAREVLQRRACRICELGHWHRAASALRH